jgi:hypothetical protein
VITNLHFNDPNVRRWWQSTIIEWHHRLPSARRCASAIIAA